MSDLYDYEIADAIDLTFKKKRDDQQNGSENQPERSLRAHLDLSIANKQRAITRSRKAAALYLRPPSVVH